MDDVLHGDADYDPDHEFVEVLTSVDGLGPRVAKRMVQRSDSLEYVTDASDEELESVQGAGRKTLVQKRELNFSN